MDKGTVALALAGGALGLSLYNYVRGRRAVVKTGATGFYNGAQVKGGCRLTYLPTPSGKLHGECTLTRLTPKGEHEYYYIGSRDYALVRHAAHSPHPPSTANLTLSPMRSTI